MLVIRYNARFELRNAKSCVHCLYEMYFEAAKKGYIIEYVYYSRNDGVIARKKLINLICQEDQYMTHNNFKKKKGMDKVRKLETVFSIKYDFSKHFLLKNNCC